LIRHPAAEFVEVSQHRELGIGYISGGTFA
jgi:hypothetical protein